MAQHPLHAVLRQRATAAGRTLVEEAEVLAGEANTAATQQRFALRRALTGRAVLTYANGERRPKYPAARALAAVSRLSIDALMGDGESSAAA